MKKIYHLSTCSTCQRILKEVGGSNKLEQQDIKAVPMTPQQLEYIAQKAGSYEAIFSRRAQKYKTMGLKEKTLTEADYKQLILDEYTFLKRPVFCIGEDVFVGNAKKTINAIKSCMIENVIIGT